MVHCPKFFWRRGGGGGGGGGRRYKFVPKKIFSEVVGEVVQVLNHLNLAPLYLIEGTKVFIRLPVEGRAVANGGV
jgi:hypothetical protein